MKEYRVMVQASAETTIYVSAPDRKSAREMAESGALTVDSEQWAIYNPNILDCEEIS